MKKGEYFMAKETKQFQAESKELLNLMINSIYTNKDVFLRELISNASDAIDKHKYLALTSNGKISLNDYEIRLELDDKKRTISISDNGIGMSKEDLENLLGTIAKSGSKDFASQIKKAKESKDLDIIGQFGVGFYSAFMVASKVEVLTKKVDDKAYLFSSEGEATYDIEDATKESSGTTITIYLKKNKDEEDYDKYTSTYTIEDLVKKYSDYVRYPIKMKVKTSKPKLDKDGKEIEGKTEEVIEDKTLNSMIPLWKKNKKDVTEEEMNEFYKSKFSDYENPDLYLQLNIEGKVNYNALLFVPSHTPYNLYSDTYEKGLQLYAKGVFIKDKCPELIPDYLKFVHGLVDSDAFSLNISREMLQHSPVMQTIADNIEKKIVDKFKDVMKNDAEKYKKLWQNFGEFFKFGIYSTYGMKKDLLQDLLMFHSLNNEDKYVSLSEYVANMKEGQKDIFYASGENISAIKMLPQMERYKKEGIDVLFFDQKIDEFAIMMLREYDKKEFKNISANKENDLSKEEKEKIDNLTADNKRILDNIKEALGDDVDEVIFSTTLVDSPVCFSTKEGLSLEMEKTLNEQPGNTEQVKAKKVLEINPDHEIFKALETLIDKDEETKYYASVLYDEAMMLEGREVKDRSSFIKKLNELLVKAISK